LGGIRKLEFDPLDFKEDVRLTPSCSQEFLLLFRATYSFSCERMPGNTMGKNKNFFPSFTISLKVLGSNKKLFSNFYSLP
jgi:hypothetical protein